MYTDRTKNLFRRLGIHLVGLVALSTFAHVALTAFSLIALTACQGNTKQATGTDAQGSKPQHVEVKYARNFILDDTDLNMRLLTVRNAEGKHATEYHYALVTDDADLTAIPEGYETIHIPVTRFICMTSLQLSNFIALDLTDRVVGITSTRHLFNEALNAQLKAGETIKIGIEGEFDNELVLAANPQLILVSPSKRGGFDVLKESGMPIMPHMGYQEADPLGQAEWVKLIGILTGHEQEALTYFNNIEQQYTTLKQQVLSHLSSQTDSCNQSPLLEAFDLSQNAGLGGGSSIFSGDMKGGAWYATGGKSFLAAIFRDAGADYVLKDNEDTGGVNMDFEAIYAQAADVDYWRISNSFDGEFSYNILAEQDSRFRDFKAFRERHVIYCNMSQTPFYESFPVHPELVLSDFVHIFYPDLLPDYTPTYYHLLEAPL